MDLRKPKKANSESGPAKSQLFPSSIGVSVLLPPGGELQLIARQEALALSHSEITATRGLSGRPWHRGRDEFVGAVEHQGEAIGMPRRRQARISWVVSCIWPITRI
ncbi:MAG: hypothetical protein KGO47_10245 [Cyanobacteria bacterium REEB417]|nr:hypothetical protein [Cyanobacteria bacterium REEB417]